MRVHVCHASAILGDSENVVQAVLNLFILKEIHHVSIRFNIYCLKNPSTVRIDHRIVGVNPLPSGDIDTRRVVIYDGLEVGFVGGQ